MTDATLEDLPPSAKFIYRVLEYADGPLSFDEIIEETRLPPSTARTAISDLEAIGQIEATYGHADARRKCYRISN